MSVPMTPLRARGLAAANWLRQQIPADDQAHCRLTSNSRTVRQGDVFLAWPGAGSDGRKHIPAAVAAGAAAVLWDDAPPFIWPSDWTVSQRSEANLKAVAGEVAAAWLNDPSTRMRVVGITGTSGKSSTAWWLARGSSALGERCALVGTLGVGFLEDNASESLRSTGLTTPDPVALQHDLADFVAQGARALAIEVSSIGLEEQRLNGVHFDIAVFTNLTRDHLDYHRDMAAYEAAKSRLFDWPGLRVAVINLDDVAGRRLAERARARGVEVLGFSTNGDSGARLAVHALTMTERGLSFTLAGTFGVRIVQTDSIAQFQVENLLAVIGVLLACGHEIDNVLKILDELDAVPGRLERVEATQGPLVLVDYAHKPDALDKVLRAARPLAEVRGGRLWVVFGCGGDRDVGKRAIMGEIADRLADYVVLTSDNPRSENPHAILSDILSGLSVAAQSSSRVVVETDRRVAIGRALHEAAQSDVVIIAGKGHESTQEIKGRKEPFSDQAVAAAFLSEASAC